MRICGKNRKGRPMCTAAPRKSDKRTKAENRLQCRIESYNAFMRVYNGPEGAYHRPGSLQVS